MTGARSAVTLRRAALCAADLRVTEKMTMHVLITGAAGHDRPQARPSGWPATARSTASRSTSSRCSTSWQPAAPAGFSGKVDIVAADLAQRGRRRQARLPARPDVIFHLAGVVSRRSRARFRQGLSGQPRRHPGAARGDPRSRRRLSAEARLHARRWRCSARRFRRSIPDDFHLTPLTSYGTQKAIGEVLLADYTRRGFCDGVGIRLPTIVVRPGKPNKAASGFFSGIIREPLAGDEALAAGRRVGAAHHASPRSAVGFLVHAAGLTREHARAAHQPHPCRASAAPSASRSRRCAASPATRSPPASGASRRSAGHAASSPAGRSASTPAARASSGFRARARSTTSSASISTTTAAAASSA